MSGPAERADEVLRVSLARADRVVTATDRAGTAALRELLFDLRQADRALSRRLRKYGSPEDRFTPASMLSYQRQIRLVIARVQARLAAITGRQSESAFDEGLRETGALLSRLEAAFAGIARPLRLRQAAVMSRAARGSYASLLAQHATSVDRYGQAMIERMETIMRRGLIEGASQRDMVNRLCGIRGPRGEVSMAAREVEPGVVVRTRVEEIPEGLFVRYRSWAWRIVRTETARAYGEGRLVGLFEQREEMPELKKKILAHFDSRTAADSVAVHGQVRHLEDTFLDGAGRVYLRPPARPNDREVVIPWLDEWGDTPTTRPRPAAQQAQAIASLGDPPRPQASALRAQLASIRSMQAQGGQ